VFLLAAISLGQVSQSSAGPGQSGPGDALSAANQSGANGQSKGGVDEERLFAVIPTYAITNDKNAPPLSRAGKFKVFFQNSTDPFIFLGIGLQAAISQATNEFPAYGQGAAGYGKRLGASYADFATSQFMSTFAFPSLLREDPRYFREGSGPSKKRLGHALSSAIVTRKDSGKNGFNWSNVLGTLAAGGISNAYYPDENRGWGLTFSRAAISIGFGTAGAIFSEFGPDLQRKMAKKKNKSNQGKTKNLCPDSQD